MGGLDIYRVWQYFYISTTVAGIILGDELCLKRYIRRPSTNNRKCQVTHRNTLAVLRAHQHV